MKKIIGIIVCGSILFGVLAVPVLAKTIDSSLIQELLQTLQDQIAKLKVQIEALVAQLGELKQAEAEAEIKETEEEIEGTLKLLRQLKRGMSGDDVALLQEILATDPDVYPEALITGYFGKLTEKAVKKFQKIAGIEQVGVVGPKTLAKLNELLEEGAGNSGKVPPGLLIAPGIRKKLGFKPILPDQDLPPGIEKKLGEEDITPPIISEISILDVATSSAMITWITDEEADSKVWYDTTTLLVITDTTLTQSSPDFVLYHEISLFDLIPDTSYYYQVNSADIMDNATSSAERAFNTLGE